MKSGLKGFDLHLLLIAVLVASTAVTWGPAYGDDDLLKQIEQQVQSARKVVESDVSQEKDLQAVQQSLQKLLKRVDEEISAIGGEENPRHPVVAAHSKLLRVLRTVDARLPEDKSSARTTRLSPLPVPQYDEKKIIGQAAAELVLVQQKLAEHMRNTKKSTPETSKLVAELVGAQEKLAWELGWPFTPEEAATMKKGGGLTAEVYLSRRNRGVERINGHLEKNLASAGREATGRRFVIYSPESDVALKAVERQLVEQRGDAVEKVWRKGTTPFDAKAFRQLAGAK